jgi:hypothetical protein
VCSPVLSLKGVGRELRGDGVVKLELGNPSMSCPLCLRSLQRPHLCFASLTYLTLPPRHPGPLCSSPGLASHLSHPRSKRYITYCQILGSHRDLHSWYLLMSLCMGKWRPKVIQQVMRGLGLKGPIPCAVPHLKTWL